MFKRLALICTLMLALPALASANWYVSASASPSTAGTVTPAGFTSYTDSTATATYSVAATAPGYGISSVRVGGVIVPPNADGTYTVSKKIATQYLVAYFTTISVPCKVTPSITAGLGSITAAFTSPLPSALVAGQSYTFKINPSPGYTVQDVLVDGSSVGAVTSYTFTNIAAGTHTLSASFSFTATVTASVSASGTMAVGSPVYLTGVASTNDTGFTGYSFAVVDANNVAQTVTPNATNPKAASFVPAAAGTYTASFTATTTTGATKTVSIPVTILSAAQSSINYCTNCHNSRNPQIVANYTASAHNGVNTCDNCHNAAAAHPGNIAASTVSPSTFDILSSGVDTGRKGNFCANCHSDEATGFFTTSTHWNNLRNNGDSAVAGDQLGTCATNKCHFKSTNAGAAQGCNLCHAPNALDAAGNVLAGSVQDHLIAKATQETSCFICHQGSHHGTPTASYKKSSHYLNPYYEGVVGCPDCHNPHSTQAAFPTYDAATFAKTADGACDKCHTGQYGIFNADNSMKQPHTAGKTATGNTNTNFKLAGVSYTNRAVLYNISSSYVTAGTTCTDCHGHNNQVNGEFAETMHADPYGRWKGARMWKFAGYSAANGTTFTPNRVAGSDGCVRCHTSTGFRNFVDSGFQDLRAWGFANTNDKTTELISCNTCHVTGKGAITGEAEVGLPEGPAYDPSTGKPWNAASIRGYNKPFPAFYNISIAKTGRFYTSVQYRNFANSNVCVPCHSGRNGATNGDAIKQMKSFTNFTTLTAIGGKVPGGPHGVYQAAVLDAKLGYTFTNYTTAANGHATIGVGGAVNTGTYSGPCVTCHMDSKTATGQNGSASYRKHNFEIKGTTVYANVCSKCHGSNFGDADLDAAKASFQAAATALGEVMANASLNKYNTAIVKYNPAISDGHGGFAPGYQLVSTTSHLVPQTLTVAQNTELVGIIYNLNLIYGLAYGGTDVGAYAHNPQYLKQLTNDTINAIRSTTATSSVADAISKIPATAIPGQTAGISAAQQNAAVTFTNNADANHYAAFATGKTTKVQYVASNTACTDCHNPAESDLQATARVAWSESAHAMPYGALNNHNNSSSTPYNGTSIGSAGTDPCVRCHTLDGFVNFTNNGSYSSIAQPSRADFLTVYTSLNCNGCHVAGLNSTNDRRSIAQSPARAAVFNGMSGVSSTLYYNYSTWSNDKTTKLRSRVAATFPDVQDSNVCIPCHAGHGNLGQNVVDVTSTPGFNPANAAQISGASMAPVSGMMYAKLGFINFTSLNATIGTSTYAKSLKSSIDQAGGITSTHRNFGTMAMYGDSHSAALFGTKASPVTGNLDQGGPCVTCHIKGNLNNGFTRADGTTGTTRLDAGHSFEIDKDAFLNVCSNCHASENGVVFGSGVAPATTDAWADFQNFFLDPNAEVYVDAQLLARYYLKANFGIYMAVGNGTAYENAARTTKVTDWTRASFMASQGKSALTTAQATKLMGAVFNLALFNNEPAAYAHARTYTRRLVYDTLDFLDDGSINLSVGASAQLASQATADADFNVAGKYVKDTNAYNNNGLTGSAQAITTIYGTTTEDMIYLNGFNRSTGAWSSPERP